VRKAGVYIKYALAIPAVLVSFLSIPAADSIAQEVLYPQGYDIPSQYTFSSVELHILDTLRIARTLVNNESFDLGNLYISDNLPPQFAFLAYSINLDGHPVSSLMTGPAPGEVVPGYYSYRWIIDLPDPADTLNNQVHPGDALELTYNFVCDSIGQFTFPLHTTCFYGDSTGFFTIAESTIVTVIPDTCHFVPGDANNNQVVNGVDITFMVNFLKGGLRPFVSCYCPPALSLYAACDVNANCVFNGVDVTYLLNYLKGFGPAPLACPTCIMN